MGKVASNNVGTGTMTSDFTLPTITSGTGTQKNQSKSINPINPISDFSFPTNGTTGQKVSSNSEVAQNAVSALGVEGISTIINGQQITIAESNISAMTNGANFSNQLLPTLNNLSNCVQKHAKKFPELAHVIETRDKQTSFSGGKKS